MSERRPLTAEELAEMEDEYDDDPIDLDVMVKEIESLGVQCDRTWFNSADQKCRCAGRAVAEVMLRYGKVRAWCADCSKDLGALVQPLVVNGALVLVKDELPATGATYELADKAVQALARAESPHHRTFVIGDTYSVVQEDGKVVELKDKALAIRFTEVAQWRNARGYANAPTSVVSAVMEAAADQESIPKLERVVTVPVFLPDGTLLDVPGYNEQSRTYYQPTLDVTVPKIVTQSDVDAAVQLLVEEYLGDVDFDTQPDRANALACMLLAFVRTLINGPTPLHVFDAPGSGHGKTQALYCSLVPGHGDVTPTSWSTSTEEQTKSLLSALRKAPSAMFIDNVSTTVRNDTLEGMLTSPSGFFSKRILGQTRDITVPVHQTWAMSTNNGKMDNKGMARRVLWIRIDAKVDDPDPRTGPTPGVPWRHAELKTWGIEHRAELVTACLVLCRWWMQHDAPNGVIGEGCAMGSYPLYQAVMAGILQCAGIEGFSDNVKFRRQLNDDKSDDTMLLQQLVEHFGEDEFNAAQCLLAGVSGEMTAKGFGQVLSKKVDVISGGLVLRKRFDEKLKTGKYYVERR